MTVTPQQENSKTLNYSSKIPLKCLTFTFGEINKACAKGFSKIFGFWDFLLLLLGWFWDSVGWGGPVGVFEKR